MPFGSGLAIACRLPCAIGLALLAVGAVPVSAAQATPYAIAPAVVSVAGPEAVAPIPKSFVGLSMEYQSLAELAGPPSDPDKVLDQLIRNLDPGEPPVLRIGGDSTDHTWYPAPGLQVSPGLSFALTPAWMQSVSELASSLDARLILGINLEADQPLLARAEARALIAGIGRTPIEAFEVGNEPSVYPELPWYFPIYGRPVRGRAPGYDFADYLRQFKRVAAALPDVPLAGPALGSTPWMSNLPRLLAAEPSLGIVTFHRYPLDRCFTPTDSPKYPTIPHLLSAAATTGLARSAAPFVAIARAAHRRFRVDELNSVECEGQSGVSNTFASALWVLDTLFAFASEGVSGVNIHTLPSAAYRLFTIEQTGASWSATVLPEYYGLLMFAQAAPPGARLLQVSSWGDRDVAGWATATRAGATEVTLINKSGTQGADVLVALGARRRPASAELLRAPSLAATGGVTLGGTSIASATTTGELVARPQTTPIQSVQGSYQVVLPPASAVLLKVT